MVLENPVIFHLISCVDQNSNIHTDSRFRTHQAPRSFIRRERGVGGAGGGADRYQKKFKYELCCRHCTFMSKFSFGMKVKRSLNALKTEFNTTYRLLLSV